MYETIWAVSVAQNDNDGDDDDDDEEDENLLIFKMYQFDVYT